jgi:pimeloyl-ACP methyl ester carboxylesterase
VFLLFPVTGPGVIPAGSSRVEVEAGGYRLSVYTYKPPAYTDGPMVVVFHGLARNAADYRDHARGLGDRFGALVVAPEFDEERFDFRRYTRGGLVKEGAVAPRREWTWSLIPEIVGQLRRREGRSEMPCYFLGHSAGGQLVGRLGGFIETGARRLVAANPGSDLFPTRELPFPYGFGGLPREIGSDDAIRRYLAQPLTIYLGTADTRRDDNLDTSPEADAQGRNRLERGRNAFLAARKLARERDWPFGWRLVEAPGVGHDGQAMFDNPSCADALFGPEPHAGK